MKTFSCACGNTLHFSNSRCVKCGAKVGFILNHLSVSSFGMHDSGQFTAYIDGKQYRECKNYRDHNVCNWMVDANDSNEYCQSCRLNETIPNLDKAGNLQLWYRLEQAKRRLIYSCIKLGLPLKGKKDEHENALRFAFMEDQTEDQYGNELTVKHFVTTGHADGLITININEADHASRLEMREKMGERYRTLVGHFRHESGHYYWDRLIANSDKLEEFRTLFGDERLDYANSMKQYYQNGPNINWQNVWISAYASMHPWEDWAETWAHYLHMTDTLETASDFEFSIAGKKLANPIADSKFHDEAYTAESFTHLLDDWCQLTTALNALNRSMGLDDAYPFVIPISALNKLRFVHEVIMDSRPR